MTNVKLLGDPHIGRTFTHGVPLHRRGERETLVWKDFETSLLEENQNVDIHVNLGDLFDAAVVSYDVLARAAEVYRAAAETYPATKFVVLRGNHDLQRNLERLSAFDLFEALVTDLPNVLVVRNNVLVLGEHAFIGFDPLTPAGELLPDSLSNVVTTLYGHYDVEAFGDQEMPNLIPTKRAAELGIKTIITGHVHLPTQFERDGVKVVVHGSMQPYSHAQDANETHYVTLGLAEALARKDELVNKCVRLDLNRGESLEEEINCLQLQIRYPQAEEDEVLPVAELGEFNLLDLFKEAMAEAQVTDTFQKQVLDEFSTRRLATAD